MPADFDTSATFRKLQLDLAVEVGLAEYDATTGKADVPTDAEGLRLIKASVNEGLKRLARAWPKWSRLEHRVQITFDTDGAGALNINNEAHRYRLPPFITSSPKGNWTFIDSASVYTQIVHTSYDQVRRYIASSGQTTGTPTISGMKPYEPEAGDDRQGFEVIFWPIPSTAYTVEAQFRVVVHDLIDDFARHPFGAEHDLAILKCAVESFRRRDEEDPQAYARAKQDMLEAIAESIELDKQLEVPRRLGPLSDPSLVQSPGNPRLWSHPGTTLINGVDVANTAH